MALNNKQKIFVEKYLCCWNATEAAKMAGYSPRTARSIGSENLTKPDIQALIQDRLNEMTISANKVLLLLSDQALASIEPFVKITDDGFISFDFSQPGALENMHLIKKIKSKRSRRVEGRGDKVEVWEYEIVEVELLDAQRALEFLGRHLGLFDNKSIQNFKPNIEDYEKLLDKVYGNPESG